MEKRNSVDALLQELNQLENKPPNDETWFGLRRGLMSQYGVAVGKAAKIASEMGWDEGIPDLIEAFDRLSHNGAKLDPGESVRTQFSFFSN